MPQAFIDAQNSIEQEKKKADMMGTMQRRLTKMFSKEDNKDGSMSGRSNQSFHNTIGSRRRQATIISRSNIGEKERELDWRDQLRQWRQV